MAVWLTRGDGDGDMCVIQKHQRCSLMTDWWWGDGCTPVCAACATLDEVTDASMREMCVGKFGPIPERNTDRIFPCPRIVGKMSGRRKHSEDSELTIVDLKCPNCGFVHVVTYGGWSAIGCPCGTDLARNKKSL